MNDNIKPIKRCEQLSSLSRQHHDFLLFVWKLRQGVTNGTDIQVLRNYCHWYWKEHVKNHFEEEENVLLKYIPSDNKMVRQLKDEHNNIRELMISIDRTPDTITIDMLADFVSRHIRFEERELLNYLEESLSPQQLDEIRSKLEAPQAPSTEWKQAFWQK